MKYVFDLFKNKKSKKDAICVFPWIHLNITPSGKVLHCCTSSDYTSLAGDLNKQTIEDVWNGDFMRSLRKQMIHGIEPVVCSKCFGSERTAGTSQRTHQNSIFKNKLQEIPLITNKDGSVDQVDLKYWDFRFSNLCNYKCRTCCPESSSSWVPDAKKLGRNSDDVNEKTVNIKSVEHKTSVDFIKKYINTVERIHFAGGEPLLVDEHWQILEFLDENKRYDVSLTYNSNLSVLKYRNKHALDYWVKWSWNIWLLPSIDEVDERAELIRSGTNWKNVETNLREINVLGIYVMPIITVSAMNVFRLPEIIDRLIGIGIINQENGWNNFSLNMVETPVKFHVNILPDEVRKDIRKRLEKYILEFEQRYNVKIRDHFLFLFWYLEKPWNKKNCREFIEFTDTLDKIRGENTWKTIPELNCIKEVK